jgi:hypothetical protein
LLLTIHDNYTWNASLFFDFGTDDHGAHLLRLLHLLSLL